jgi:hypothetical protein
MQPDALLAAVVVSVVFFVVVRVVLGTAVGLVMAPLKSAWGVVCVGLVVLFWGPAIPGAVPYLSAGIVGLVRWLVEIYGMLLSAVVGGAS